MTNTVKFEQKAYYDSYGTGNYTEDKSKRLSLAITEEQAKQYVESWLAAGCMHYETSKAFFFEFVTDSSHYEQYILYK